MKIAISGASGYVGSYLQSYLSRQGHEVCPLGRHLFRVENRSDLSVIIAHCDVVINLAGASINKRWTKAYKKELYESRIDVTRTLVQVMNQLETPPSLFISTSAVGYYAAEGVHDEYTGQKGNDFLSDLCEAWEWEAAKCPPETRLVTTRFGVVLSPEGGAMEQMLRVQRLLRCGVVIGKGEQPFPWIALEDLCRAMEWIIRREEVVGPLNLVAPQQLSQRELAEILIRMDGIKRLIALPDFVFRLRFGEGASFVTKGQRVIGRKLKDLGFTFTYPDLEELVRVTRHHTVPSLDIQRYMGKWYEIARYNHWFEKDMTHVSADYTLLPDGKIRVVNEGRTEAGKLKRTIGRAKQPEPQRYPGRLKVAFFLWFYADYYILELDENYQYVVIGSNTDDYLWILSRQKTLDAALYDKLLLRLQYRGYDIQRLLRVEQGE